MSDVVVCLPKSFRWGGHRSAIASWFAEGGAPGQAVPAGTWYSWSIASPPRIAAGERVYVVHQGFLLGYAPLLFMQQHLHGRGVDLVRAGGAVLVSLADTLPAFRGFRYRSWDRADEIPITAANLVSLWPELAALPAFAGGLEGAST